METQTKEITDLFGTCPYVTTQKIISGKWKIIILYYLSEGTHRFSELNKKMPGVAQATLTSQLRALEASGLIDRKVYPQVPPKVEYRLSELGERFRPVLQSIDTFGQEYIQYLEEE
jgi:DNA-binding HxlR family transcriptional regulator